MSLIGDDYVQAQVKLGQAIHALVGNYEYWISLRTYSELRALRQTVLDKIKLCPDPHRAFLYGVYLTRVGRAIASRPADDSRKAMERLGL